ncbi:unnamed protein product, partial [Mesorhabditis belari]|uniref:Phosphorylase b kinase regulatory subunit n=1 Tax=Mesorhabditis belari TaxID=2138241 RepID=A0AAF3EAV7_9BILA
MRSRSGSGVRLDRLLFLVEQTILKNQDAATGLFANNCLDFPGQAWVRDNVYAAHALWALYRAYQKSAEFDEDLIKAGELGMTCVKLMQSLLDCMMRQANKVELFKQYQRSPDAIHAKFSSRTKSTVCGDTEWGHLQLDAVSLFLLTIAQMTASGLQIVRNFDEVAFVQNLVYYIEVGYRTPDFGIWERGDKTNQGIRELNASSIGMVKAALQAMNDVGDLFGDGSKTSVITVMPDEIEQCSAVLNSMLPRESFSKETDAALLTIISYPAFSVEDPELVTMTRDTITKMLLGTYGCRRFLRDGYRTVLEDRSRLYYNKSELQQFEDIECEWPLFLCLLALDAMFCKDKDTAEIYWNQLEKTLQVSPTGQPLVPELFVVDRQHVAAEKAQRGSQPRTVAGVVPFLWAQSLYVIVSLLYEGFLAPAELDPLSRRLTTYEKRPPCEVQVSILAENGNVQRELRANGIIVQRVDEVDPVFSIQPASKLAELLEKIGESKKLGLSGRPRDREVGLLSTSRLYQLGSKFVIFTPQFMDSRRSHLMYDIRILMDEWSSELQYIYASWNSVSISGRPLVVLVINENMLSTDGLSPFSSISLNRFMKSTVIGTIKKINTGYLGGARVVMRNISDFFRTTAVLKLEFRGVNRAEDLLKRIGEERIQFNLPTEVDRKKSGTDFRATRGDESPTKSSLKRTDSVKDRRTYNLVHKASMRHRSIILDSNDSDLVQLRLAFAKRDRNLDDTSGNPSRELSPVNEPSCLITSSKNLLNTEVDARVRLDISQKSQMSDMRADDLADMLLDTNQLEEQASILHCLWMKCGPDHLVLLNDQHIPVRLLMEETYSKACESRDWALTRLTAGLLNKRLEELGKAVTHLLVRQKQITVGMPSKREEAITCPKTNEELKEIMFRAYHDDPNSFTLSQEIIVALGSLVRTEAKLFVEMFRLRIGLIIQILASELARLRSLSATDALQNLLMISPFELKSMLLMLLSGRLLEETQIDDETAAKETRTGIGSFRKHIEERKSLRKSMRQSRRDAGIPPPKEEDEIVDESVDEAEVDDFQFGIWLRHRRIDGALNRVPNHFYATLWDTVHRFPHGLRINGNILHWGLTQEMTRREIKFALEVEEILNQISEPEYREMVVETLWLLGRLDRVVRSDSPRIPHDKPFEVDQIVIKANQLFVSHNCELGTIVLDCCASKKSCGGARGLCVHFLDSAPAGEYGTSHYIIRALADFFT